MCRTIFTLIQKYRTKFWIQSLVWPKRELNIATTRHFIFKGQKKMGWSISFSVMLLLFIYGWILDEWMKWFLWLVSLITNGFTVVLHTFLIRFLTFMIYDFLSCVQFAYLRMQLWHFKTCHASSQKFQSSNQPGCSPYEHTSALFPDISPSFEC